MVGLTAHLTNWFQTSLTTRWWTKTAGFIESCTPGVGAPPQTPLGAPPPNFRRPRRKKEAGGSSPDLHCRSAPTPAGAPPESDEEQDLGASPQLHSCGKAAPGAGNRKLSCFGIEGCIITLSLTKYVHLRSARYFSKNANLGLRNLPIISP